MFKIYLLKLFQFVIIIPAALLCYMPMKNQLWYAPKKIVLKSLALFLLTAPLLAIVCLYADFNINFIFIPYVMLLFLYYKSTLKADLSRALAVYVFSFCIFSFPSNLSFGFDAFLHPENSYNEYGWAPNIFRLVISLLLIFLLTFPLKKYIQCIIDNLQISRIWYLTLPISIMFIILNMVLIPHNYQIMYVGRVFSMYSLLELFLFILYIFLCVIFYFICVEILSKIKLTERQKFFEMQESQYNELKSHMEDIRRLRHDMRQSAYVLHNLAKTKDFESIEKYLTEYETSLPTTDYRKYCDNNAVDALLNYYAGQEYEYGINMNWQIDLPELTSVSETDLCSMIGNLIENAIQGCAAISPDERNHSLTIVTKNKNSLYIVSTNTFDGNIKQIGGNYISTKGKSSGIGISSICMTVEKYNGTAKFHHSNNEFYADIMLKINCEV